MWDGHLGCCVKKRQNKLLAKCSLGICSIHLCVCRSGQRTTVRWVGNRRIICVNRWGAIVCWVLHRSHWGVPWCWQCVGHTATISVLDFKLCV